MFDEHKDNQLDGLLNSLLSEYSAVEPRPGLQTRILANLREAAARKGSWLKNPFLAWAGAAAGSTLVAAALLILFFLFHPIQLAPPAVVHRVEPAPLIPGVQQTTSRPELIHSARRSHNVQRNVQRNPVLSVRADVFPTPTPLSEQEKLLLRYVAGTPREEQLAQSHADVVENASEEPSEPPRDMTQVLQRSSNSR